MCLEPLSPFIDWLLDSPDQFLFVSLTVLCKWQVFSKCLLFDYSCSRKPPVLILSPMSSWMGVWFVSGVRFYEEYFSRRQESFTSHLHPLHHVQCSLLVIDFLSTRAVSCLLMWHRRFCFALVGFTTFWFSVVFIDYILSLLFPSDLIIDHAVG